MPCWQSSAMAIVAFVYALQHRFLPLPPSIFHSDNSCDISSHFSCCPRSPLDRHKAMAHAYSLGIFIETPWAITKGKPCFVPHFRLYYSALLRYSNASRSSEKHQEVSCGEDPSMGGEISHCRERTLCGAMYQVRYPYSPVHWREDYQRQKHQATRPRECLHIYLQRPLGYRRQGPHEYRSLYQSLLRSELCSADNAVYPLDCRPLGYAGRRRTHLQLRL